MVVAGEWRDYAIDFRDDAAVFSVFRRAAEIPLYSIEKRPRLKDRQGQYSVVAAGGQVLGRGHDLDRRPARARAQAAQSRRIDRSTIVKNKKPRIAPGLFSSMRDCP